MIAKEWYNRTIQEMSDKYKINISSKQKKDIWYAIRNKIPILLLGETMTGKTVLARKLKEAGFIAYAPEMISIIELTDRKPQVMNLQKMKYKQEVMNLQKMKYKQDGKIKIFVCAINIYCHGGEYTFCGNAIPDSTLEYDDMENVGDIFKGELKDLTCPNCINIYVKSFK